MKRSLASILLTASLSIAASFGMVVDPYGYSSGGATFNPAAGDYAFNEGSGTTLANGIGTAGTDATLSSSSGWGSGNYNFPANVTFETPNNTFAGLNDFTIAVWVAPSALAASGNIDLAIMGNGSSTSGANTKWRLQATNTTVVGAVVNSSNTSSTLTLNNALDTSNTWLVMFRYDSIGSGTSEGQIDITHDCVTWFSASKTDFDLMKSGTNSMELRRTGNSSSPAGVAGVYERMTMFGYKFSDTQRNVYCSNGMNASIYN